jgi:hypothetical protein
VKDYFYKFPDQATMLEALHPLGMTYIDQEFQKDEHGNYVYTTVMVQAKTETLVYDEEMEETVNRIENVVDDQGNPVMVEEQQIALVDVEKVSQGGHQYACWELGLLPDSPTDWHLNLRVVDPEFDVSSLEQYAVSPRNPRCVFA